MGDRSTFGLGELFLWSYSLTILILLCVCMYCTGFQIPIIIDYIWWAENLVFEFVNQWMPHGPGRLFL